MAVMSGHAALRHQAGRELEQRKLSMDRATLPEYFATIRKPAKLAVEATFNWYYLLDLIEPLEFELRPPMAASPFRARVANHRW
jgi:hypothetical protein